MSNFCPAGPEFDALKRELGGEALAHFAYNKWINKGNSDIPTPQEARILIQEANVINKDEQLSRSSSSFKYQKALEQQFKLETLERLAKNKSQKKAIQKLIQNTRLQQLELINAITREAKGESIQKTVSVTKFCGKGDFKGDSVIYESYKYFGTFLHEFVDEMQTLSNNLNEDVSKLATKEQFLDKWNLFTSKNPIIINNLEVELLYEQAKDLIKIIDSFRHSGSIVVPEISVTGVSSTGSTIIGRLDILVIDSNGKVNILDFKTKKMNGIFNYTSEGKSEDLAKAFSDLGNSRYPISDTAGVSQEYLGVTRSSFDDWMVQLDIYENMLLQNGLEVADKSVVAFMYDIDNNGDYQDAIVYHFKDQAYYDQSLNMIPDEKAKEYSHLWYLTESNKTHHINKLKAATNRAIPVSLSAKQDTKGEKGKARYEITPTEKALNNLVDKLVHVVDANMATLAKEKKKLVDANDEKNNALIELINTRMDSLRAFKAIAIKNSLDPQATVRAVNFFTAAETVAEDVKKILEITLKSIEVFEKNGSNPKKTPKQVTEILDAFTKSEDLRVIVDEMQDIINEAVLNPENNISKDSGIKQMLAEINANIQTIQSQYKKMAIRVWLEIARTPGEEVFKDVKEQLRQRYEPELAYLMEKKEKLEQNVAIGPLKSLKKSVMSLLSPKYKQELKDATTQGLSVYLQELDEISKKIEIVKARMEGFGFDEATLIQYIEGASNPESLRFPGSELYVADVIAYGRPSFDNLIASASNSDIAVATPVIMMKNAKAQAEHNAFSDERLLKLDTKIRELKKKYSSEELNNAISGWVEVPYFDSETKEMKTKKVFSLVTPYSEKYQLDLKNVELKQLSTQREYHKVYAEFHEGLEKFKKQQITEDEYKALEDKVKESKKAKEDAKKDYLDFIIKYSNKPYTEEFYKLQSQLPEDIRDKINDLFYRREILLYKVGPENVIDLDTDEDYDEVQEIDIEIKKLRQEAKERDPMYADYIDRFNELYEYQTDDALFERRRKSAEIKYEGTDTEKYKEWLGENLIERPSQLWYNTLNELYEEKQFLMAQMPSSGFEEEIGELNEEKSKILAPYKRFGKINTKYMNDLAVEQVDAITSRLDEIYAEIMSRPKVPGSIDRNLIKLIKEVNNSINSMVVQELTESYKTDFEDKYTNLENKWKLVVLAQSKRDEALSNYDSSKTPENLKVLEKLDEKLQEDTSQFVMVEQSFEKWFNKYHNSTYESISTGADSRSFRQIKQFNYYRFPNKAASADYVESVPNPKYFQKKQLRKENWILNGEQLHSTEIEALRQDPNFDEKDAVDTGSLIIKPGAYNPDYHKGPGGILLPKGVKHLGNSQYDIDAGFDGDPHIDPKFKALKQNPDFLELYKLVTNLYFGMQSSITGKKMGYDLPGFASTIIEKYARTGSLSETLKAEYEIFKDKHFKVNSEQDYTANVFGDLKANTRMRYTQQLSEGLQSEDALTSVMKYSVEAQYNVAMSEVSPMVDTYINHLKIEKENLERQYSSGKTTFKNKVTGKDEVVDMKARAESLANIINVLEFERRKFIYGQAEDNTHRSVKKALSALFAYTSFIRIGFDVANQVKNNFAGNVQAFIASGNLKSNHYSHSDLLAGKKFFYTEFMKNFFKDYGKLSEIEVSTMLYRHFNPSQKDILKYFEESGGGAKRKIATKLASPMELAYFLQDKGESEVAITVMYAILNNHQVKLTNPDGSYQLNDDGTYKTIPAHQVYIKGVNGELAKRKDVEFTDVQENRLRNTIYSEMRRAQGNYAKSDMSKFEEGIMGKMVFFYRKFLVPAFLNRFGYTKPSWEAGEVATGYWRGVYQMFKFFGPKNAVKELILGSKFLNRFGGNGLDNVIRKPGQKMQTVKLQPGEDMNNEVFIRQSTQARKDMFVMSLLTIFSLIALGYIRKKDDDDEELGVLEGNAFRILWGVTGETTSMFPVGGGSDEYIRNFTTAIPMVREVTKLKTMGTHAYSFGLAMIMNGGEEPEPGYDSQYYEEVYKDAFYVKKQGPYEAGTSKIRKDFVDLTGLKNFRDLFNPEYRIDDLKKKQ